MSVGDGFVVGEDVSGVSERYGFNRGEREGEWVRDPGRERDWIIGSTKSDLRINCRERQRSSVSPQLSTQELGIWCRGCLDENSR